MKEIEKNLQNFIEWTNKNITGDEKGEAQIFLDRFFQALGHDGCLNTGGAAEYRIQKENKGRKNTSFADYVWKPFVLIEMKKRGTDLKKHYTQAFNYWVHLVPNRPRYVMLCNFDEIWIYDFELQLDSPVDQIFVSDLDSNYGALLFLLPKPRIPTFKNDHEVVTREAADKVAKCFNSLLDRRVDKKTAQNFILQSLVALFAEDIGLLERYTFTSLLDRCLDQFTGTEESYDLIGGLFGAMATPGQPTGGRFKGVGYFNGGLFQVPARIELLEQEIILLRDASRSDWSQVRPEIFGTLFERSLDSEERHAFGAHFTHPTDIMKIIKPTITEPWESKIEGARTQRELNKLHIQLQSYRVLDPACGSGNFLYLAYRELKRLEARIYERLDELSTKDKSVQNKLGFVNAKQFFGIDIDSFAIEIAKVTMMIGRKLAVDELPITENILPLDNLDENFFAKDALIDQAGQRQGWPESDVIIGNPPFLGAKKTERERGASYMRRLRSAYPEILGMADYCVHWFRRAHDHVKPCKKGAWESGRVGLVGTQNIRHGKSRESGLDYIVKSGVITEAIDNQPWSGEAGVHVSIVNWLKDPDPEIVPNKRRLWKQLPWSGSNKYPALRSRSGHDIKSYQLTCINTNRINSALSDRPDFSNALPLKCNKKPKRTFQGKTPGYDDFVIDDKSTANKLDAKQSDVIWPYLIGSDILSDFRPKRWIIDFRNMSMEEASKRHKEFKYCQKNILPKVEKAYSKADKNDANISSQRAAHLKRWWQLWMPRTDLTSWLESTERYIACSRVTRWPVFVFVSSKVSPGDSLQVFAFNDDYSFGVLQSSYHFEWIRSSSRLKLEWDLRYTSRHVFDKFPWPQNPDMESVLDVAETARELREVRKKALTGRSDGLRGLYRLFYLPGESDLKKVHKKLDDAVLRAYGIDNSKDPLQELLSLNKEVASRIDNNQAVIPPGIPLGLEGDSRLYSQDCLTP